jgi:hypothetical protein
MLFRAKKWQLHPLECLSNQRGRPVMNKLKSKFQRLELIPKTKCLTKCLGQEETELPQTHNMILYQLKIKITIQQHLLAP